MKRIFLVLICLSSDLSLSAETNKVVQGTDSDDVLFGTDSVETIFGGAGNDTIESGKGSDILYGGAGSDMFVVNFDNSRSFDTVMDLNPAEGDKVLFDLSISNEERTRYRIPKKLSYRNISLDRKGNVNIKLTTGIERTFLNIKRSDLELDIEDKGSKALIKFKVKF